jgi:hypothetical protein
MILTTTADTIPYETDREDDVHGIDLFDETENTQPEPVAIAAAIELGAEDEAERLWWDKVDTLGKIKDCSRLIQETESEIDGYQDQIKEAKEVLKGQQALLARYASQLADILDGHPLPRNPNRPAEPVASEQPASDWQATPTKELLAGIKGCGAKKLEAICDVAPTAGKLQELRIEASTGCRDFREVLPKGCGEQLADEIINRLDDHIMRATAAAEDEGEPEGDC